jgi:hypothetical protein
MSFLHAYAHAQRVGADFICPAWIGDQVFNLPEYGHKLLEHINLPVRSELNLKPDETDIVIRGYAQNQAAMIYTKKQAQEWLVPRLSLEDVFPADRADLVAVTRRRSFIAHRRSGDYLDLGYPVVSQTSIDDGIRIAGLNPDDFYTCTEEHPTPAGEACGNNKFLPDFYRMLYAGCLFRGNSSFSWLAGLLSTGVVFSPVIKGLQGGKEHNLVNFVPGNWPALSDLACGTDMHLPT